MNFTRKIDRARQWAGEKMGVEAKATQTDDFKALMTETDLRHDGMERLHKSMNVYTRWAGRRCDSNESRSRASPLANLGQVMVSHGVEIDQASEFGRCLVSTGNAYEKLAELQNSYLDCANATWVQQMERDLAMMKEYQSARKKLENRRLAYDATMAKMQKAKQDTRIEEELRINKTKFDDTTEDVYRRMQDIKEAEVESLAALTSFLDAEMEYHERAVSEMRRLRESIAGAADVAARPSSREMYEVDRGQMSLPGRSQQAVVSPPAIMPAQIAPAHSSPPRPIARAMTTRPAPPPPPPPPVPASSRPPPPLTRATTYDARRPSVAQIYREDGSNDDTSSGSDENGNGSGLVDRGLSPATSYGSLLGSSNGATGGGKKVPPPPPVSRARKPPPPPVPRKINAPGI